MIKRAVVAAVVACAGSVIFTGSANAQVPTYTITTRYDAGSGCTVVRDISVPVGIPVPVDAGGTPAPDLLVALVAVPPPVGSGQASLLVVKLTPDALRVAVTVAVQGLSFGYDACSADTAPQTFRATATASGSNTTLSVETTEPGNKLKLIGEAGGRIVEATLQPVPATTTVSVSQTASGVTATLATTVPTRIDIVYVDSSGLRAEGTIDRFPGAATIEASSSSIRYTASAPVQTVGMDIRSGTTRLQIMLTDVPTEVRIFRNGTTGVGLRSGRIGAIDAALTSGTTSASAPAVPVNDHLAVRKEGSAFGARLLLRGVTSADVDWADPLLVDLQHDARPFQVAAVVDGTTIVGAIADVPARATIRFSATGRTLTYTGSAIIGEIRASVSRIAPSFGPRVTPLFGRVRRADLLVRQLPTSLNLTLAPSGSSIVVDGNGATLGLIEALFTSGPDQRLAASEDGVLFRDLSDRYLIFVRVTGLQRFAYTDTRTVVGTITYPHGSVQVIDHVKQFNLVTNGGRTFRADVERAEPAEPDGREFVMVTMASMPSNMTATMTRRIYRDVIFGVERDSGVTRLNYSANATSPWLHVDTNAGARHHLGVHLAPVPRTLAVCTDGASNSCVPSSFTPADKGTTSIVASDRTTFSVYDCDRLVNGSCAVDFSEISLNLLKFDIAVDERSDGFRMWLDTDAQGVHGRIRKVIGGTTEYDFLFPDRATDMWAQNRHTTASCGLISCSGFNTGTMFCPSGTSFRINTHNFRYGIADFAEEICP